MSRSATSVSTELYAIAARLRELSIHHPSLTAADRRAVNTAFLAVLAAAKFVEVNASSS